MTKNSRPTPLEDADRDSYPHTVRSFGKQSVRNLNMTTTLQTNATMRNPFLAYAEAMAPRRLDGEMLKFVKGDYLVGKDGKPLPTGTQLVAIMNTLMIGWVKWQSDKPVDARMGYVADGFQPPRRRDLDDFESDKWEQDRDGDLRDPWQFTNSLVLIDPVSKANIYTFTTTSRGGFGAIAELCKAHAKAPAGSYERISLEVGQYQHNDRSIGKVKFPIFKALEHVQAAPYDEALVRSRGETEALTAPTEAPAAIGARPFAPIDDDIPFAPEWR